MGAMDLNDLARLWGSEDLTTEQGVGQLVQHAQQHHARLVHMERLSVRVAKLDERLQRVERMLEAMVKALVKERDKR